jgi:hypothetical protein
MCYASRFFRAAAVPLALLLSKCPNVGAQNWIRTVAPDTNWIAVASSADGNKLVAAVSTDWLTWWTSQSAVPGQIYVSTNAGATWNPTSAPLTNWLSVCCSADGNTVAAEAGSAIYISRDSGASWKATSPIEFPGNPSIACSADGTKIFAAGGVPLVLTSTNSGETWQGVGPSGIPVGLRFDAVASSADGNKTAIASLCCGSSFVDVHADLWDSFWRTTSSSYLGSGYEGVASSASGEKLAVFLNDYTEAPPVGKLRVSADAGTNWNVTRFATTNFTSIAISSDGSRIVALAIGNAIYMSSNSGTTWTASNVPFGKWSSVASSADGTRLVAVVNGGGIYTWQAEATPALSIILPANPGLMLSWTVPFKRFELEQSSDLPASNWERVLSTPRLSYSNVQYQVVLPKATPSTFYRLISP